jgi:hypothetical protein
MPRTASEPSLEIRALRVDDLRGSAEASVLFEDHWQEVAKNKRVMILSPNWRKYYALEEQGMMLILGMFAVQRRSKVEVMIGYSVNFITDHMHYSNLKVCQNDLIFIDQEWRKGRKGLRLILATESAGKERGAQLMLWHAKQGTTLDALLPRMNYGVQDIIYSKEL